MNDFFRFPHTPHLAWLGAGAPRDDKVLDAAAARALLSGEVIVEEKLDGANLGVSLDGDRVLRLQNRGQYLIPPLTGQFSRAAGWIAAHQQTLAPVLGDNLILFGEWCAARHSIVYSRLPDWFFVFDVYDRMARRFWSAARRDALAARIGLAVVPQVARGSLTLRSVEDLATTRISGFGDTPMEGVIVRRDGANYLEDRAKIVRPSFTQGIDEHWRTRRIEWNALAPARQERQKAT